MTLDPREYEKLLIEKGRSQERVRRLREEAIADPGIREAARLVAWQRHDEARIRMVPGGLEFPETWPPDSVDEDNEVSAFVDARFPDLRRLMGEDEP